VPRSCEIDYGPLIDQVFCAFVGMLDWDFIHLLVVSAKFRIEPDSRCFLATISILKNLRHLPPGLVEDRPPFATNRGGVSWKMLQQGGQPVLLLLPENGYEATASGLSSTRFQLLG
jgi:hypothetical protein